MAGAQLQQFVLIYYTPPTAVSALLATIFVDEH